MRKQSTKAITLVFIASLAMGNVGCGKKQGSDQQRVYMRADTTARYSQTHAGHSNGGNSALTNYLLFRALTSNGSSRFVSNGISASSNVGTNSSKSKSYSTSSYAKSGRSSISTSKATTSRGGFGSSSYSRSVIS